jgi:hypothetical protein
MVIIHSQFVAHWAANKRHIPASARDRIARIYRERMAAHYARGRADEPLNFADLCEAIEDAIVGRSNYPKA